ncbi:MAG: DNA methyltransferase [Armatimonadota bacterium]
MKLIEKDLVTLEEASIKVGKTIHNIRDYIQRGKIQKYNPNGELITKAKNGELRVSLFELEKFLHLINMGIDKHHKAGLHPELGFYDLPEYERTKHVHRLHPYLGKFIPQLVEWFLRKFFANDDLILDPFMGSGTTLVQGNEMNINTVGIDISPFNCLIAKVKTDKYDIENVKFEVLDAKKKLSIFSKQIDDIDNPEKLNLVFDEIENYKNRLLDECKSEYLNKWFAKKTLLEMLYYKSLIPIYKNQDLLKIILCRAVRSSRLIPHYDLATPKKPLKEGEVYWCRKHNRYCKPIDNCLTKINAYSMDTLRRIEQYNELRTNKNVLIIQGDSRYVDINSYLENTELKNRKFDGIFTSPPYVGQIDYHDQHIYAYELLGIERYDNKEIGPKNKGKSKKAINDYIVGISDVFKNAIKFMKPDAKIFIVANDRFNIYPEIAQRSGMEIVEEFQRAVTKRTEQGDDPYQETIFQMRIT